MNFSSPPKIPTNIPPTEIEDQYRMIRETCIDILMTHCHESVIQVENIKEPYFIVANTIDGDRHLIGWYRTFKGCMTAYNYIIQKIQEGHKFVSAAERPEK